MVNKKKILIVAALIAISVAIYIYWNNKKKQPEVLSDTDKSIDAATKEQSQKVTVKPEYISDRIVSELDKKLYNPLYKSEQAYNEIIRVLSAMKNRADYNAVNDIFRTKRAGGATKRTLLNALISEFPNNKSQLESIFTRIGLIKDSSGVWKYDG